MTNERRAKGWLLAASAVLVLSGAPARAEELSPVSVVSKLKDLTLKIYGFVETDLIRDSKGGFNEEQGNNLVPKDTAGYPGQNSRTQMSVRNSRIGFDLSLPKTDSGLIGQGILELDALGNNASNTQPGSAPGTQTERDFFNNPAIRVRHAYLNMTYNDWNVKAGQTWSLLGWQPYYFPNEVIVQPAVGQLYRRFAQFRVTNTQNMGGWTVETAADAAKPPNFNGGMPEYHAGLRLASTERKASSPGGAGNPMVAMSGAVSAALIPVRTNAGNVNGSAVAFDAFLPIIASPDGKDRANNLSLIGEVMTGQGVGGLEYSGLALGVPGVTPALGGTAVDSGIAGINAATLGVELIHYRVFRTNLVYVLPCAQWAISGGYAQVEGTNTSRFALDGSAAQAAIAPKIQFGYVSVFYDPKQWLRLGLEVAQTRDTYNDMSARYAINNRVQFSTFFTF